MLHSTYKACLIKQRGLVQTCDECKLVRDVWSVVGVLGEETFSGTATGIASKVTTLFVLRELAVSVLGLTNVVLSDLDSCLCTGVVKGPILIITWVV